ncbi:MAG: Trk system potassium transporter TrkA [Pseudomonadales bacterium]|nr:Trk system potassium transporter TrkA [Pseudomonadales bacterium]
MKIIILGAGQVGGTLAEHLASEANDITLVDTNGELLHSLQDRLDIGTVQGMASHPKVLKRAGAEDADLLIAVTNSDETNMIACQIGYSLFKITKRIARVRSTSYHDYPALFDAGIIPIDVLIHPEKLITDQITRLLDHPGALQVVDFADGIVQLVAVKAVLGGPLVGCELQDLRKHIPSVDTRVAAIFRRGKAIMPVKDTIIETDDEVFFIADRKDIQAVMGELRRLEKPYKRIMVVGGGNIGAAFAKSIESRYQIKVIESSEERCNYLSELLNKSIVLHGSGSDKQLLLEEDIEDVDVFCALTNDDEANIMASLLAKRLGANKVMTLISKPAYVDLVQGGEIDIAISPQQATVSSLLTHVRRGDMVNVHSLRRGAAEAIELIVHGDKRSSRVIGRTIGSINLPAGTTIGAIVREIEGSLTVIIAHHNIEIQAEDHVILFLTDKRKMREVEQLFQVGFGFF